MTRGARASAAAALGVAVALVLCAVASAQLVTYYEVPNELRNPDHIVPGPDGALWFNQYDLQSKTSALGRITTSGVVSVVPTPSHAPISSMTAGPDGALWYAGTVESPIGPRAIIGRVAAGGVTERGLHDEFDVGAGIATGPDRAIWFLGFEGYGRLAADGTPTFFALPKASGPFDDFVAGPDALWFARTEAIYRVAPDGTRRRYDLKGFLGDLVSTSLAPAADGSLWFAPGLDSDSRRYIIGQLVASGRKRIVAAPTRDSAVTALTVGSDGTVWYLGLGGLGRLSPSGELTELYLPDRPRYLSLQEGITQGPDGAIWFTERSYDDSADDDDVIAGRIGRLDVARLLPTLLTARLERRSLRGRRNRLLRIRFAASRDATALLYVSRGVPRRGIFTRGVPGVRVLRARRGANAVRVRLPAEVGTYRVTLRLERYGRDPQAAYAAARVKVTR